MAIKISGTTVIDDSRNISNVPNINITGNVATSASIAQGAIAVSPTLNTVGFGIDSSIEGSTLGGGSVRMVIGPNATLGSAVGSTAVLWKSRSFYPSGGYTWLNQIIARRTAVSNDASNHYLSLESNGGSSRIQMGDYIISFHANGAQRSYIATRWVLVGTGSRGVGGQIVVTTNNTVGIVTRQAGYVEWNTDAGYVGTNYFLSDERKKTNIQPTSYDALSFIDNINFIEFDWKPESGQEGHEKVGVSAQQLQSLDPGVNLVREMKDYYLSVDENKLATILGKALQQAIQEIESLEQRISQHENNI